MAMYIYLERLQDEEAGEEGDDEGREPMADLVIAEGDPVGPDQEHGEEDGGEAEQPGQGQTQGRQLEPLLLLLLSRQLFFWPRRLLSDVITKRRGWPHGRRGGGGLEGPGNAVAAQGEGAGSLPSPWGKAVFVRRCSSSPPPQEGQLAHQGRADFRIAFLWP